MILCFKINSESWLIISVSKFSIHLAEKRLLLNGMLWNVMEFNKMLWNVMEWNGMEWNGMEWNGM